MRRALLTFLLVLSWPAAADAATVKVVDCVPALARAERSATFEARVRAVPETERMQVRFTLLVRAEGPDARWRRVVAAGFDEWLTSDAGVRRYVYDRTVSNLAAPAGYRTQVRFRWLEADGAVARSARATSATCRQPDLRPDLVPIGLEVAPGPDDDTRRYTAVLRNEGRSDAAAFTVALAGAEPEPAPVAVARLAAGAQRTVAFTGPACVAGERVSVALDPLEQVDERNEEDNALAVPCPAP